MNVDRQAGLVEMGRRAKSAARELALLSGKAKNSCLRAIAKALESQTSLILQANASDISKAEARESSAALVDRLRLTPARVKAMASSLLHLVELADPVGCELACWTRPNGLRISRISVPFGVIGIIFESRPNVMVDASALCLKSGNACILRGGSDAFETVQVIGAIVRSSIGAQGHDPDLVQVVPTADREVVGEMLAGLDGSIDLIVPRGGKALVARVQAEARVPVLCHLEGICHTYVHRAVDLAMAKEVVLNAKMRRPGICGATETLLVDREVASPALPPIMHALWSAGCEIRGDKATQQFSERVRPTTEEDWSTEYLDAIISIKIVESLDEAIDHIEKYGSHHTDAILTQDEAAATHFLNRVNSAIVLHNASTQFADGGEFGFGAEIGIATGKLHARGPVGLEQLTTYKYVLRGTGQTRPE